MIRLFAPHPAYRILIFLPNAEWGDFQRLESTTQLHRSMNGAVTVTHVRRLPNIRVLEINLRLTRLKSIEFINFYELFNAELLKMEFQNGDSFIGYMRVNPFELEVLRRSVVAGSKEEVTTRFDLETVQ